MKGKQIRFVGGKYANKIPSHKILSDKNLLRSLEECNGHELTMSLAHVKWTSFSRIVHVQ